MLLNILYHFRVRNYLNVLLGSFDNQLVCVARYHFVFLIVYVLEISIKSTGYKVTIVYESQ